MGRKATTEIKSVIFFNWIILSWSSDGQTKSLSMATFEKPLVLAFYSTGQL